MAVFCKLEKMSENVSKNKLTEKKRNSIEQYLKEVVPKRYKKIYSAFPYFKRIICGSKGWDYSKADFSTWWKYPKFWGGL